MEQLQDILKSKYWGDKRILITGGTQGLGRAMVTALQKLGARIAVVARTSSDLDDIRELGDNIYTIPADVSLKDDIHRISGQAVGMMEGVDILINNASYLGQTPLRSLLDTECEDFGKVLETNLVGPFRLIKAIIPYMRVLKSGLIVNISSDAAISAYPTWGTYSVSKAALDHMTAIWEVELQDEPIQFLSVDPGDMYTQMHLDAIPSARKEDLYLPDDVAVNLLQFLQQENFGKIRYSAKEWRNLL